MTNNHSTAPCVSLAKQDKDSKYLAQSQRVFAAFYRQPKTMLTASIETGILRANICRYIAELRKQGRIKIARYGICPVSKHRAGFYTTNPVLYPKNNQLNLFETTNIK